MGCKCLMGVVEFCRGDVSQSNSVNYSSWGGQKCHIHAPEATYLINQNC
jgi:hypothetical protein